MALSIKRGRTPKPRARGPAKAMAESMTDKQLRDYAKKPRSRKAKR